MFGCVDVKKLVLIFLGAGGETPPLQLVQVNIDVFLNSGISSNDLLRTTHILKL